MICLFNVLGYYWLNYKEIDIEKFFEDRSNGNDMNDFEGFNVKILLFLLLFLKINNVYIYIYL